MSKITRADLFDRPYGWLRTDKVVEALKKGAHEAGRERPLTDLHHLVLDPGRHLHWDVDPDAYDLLRGAALGLALGAKLADEARGWKADESTRVHYADNSVEVTYVAADGGRKTVMEKAPSGDACF